MFELTPKAGRGWKETILHNFNNNGRDGIYPYGGLIFDGTGNLYGTTAEGGAHNGGTVFELTPKAGGGWTEKVLHAFNYNNGSDGTNPYVSLIFDAVGNLYGTTYNGGSYNHGTVFELTPKAGGGWTETVLYNFNPNGIDGTNPYASLIFDGTGNLYSTTNYGGSQNSGTVFELTPQAGGGWTESVLHSFKNNSRDGNAPFASLILDSVGNLYGTTSSGGAHGDGTVFELTPSAGGGWTEKVLHNFNLNGRDGASPFSGLIFDAAGNLYGTTLQGGDHTYCGGGCGTVFELTPKAGGGWTEKLLHKFNFFTGKSGEYPNAGLVFDAAGNLYGTTLNGGVPENAGTVFEIIP